MNWPPDDPIVISASRHYQQMQEAARTRVGVAIAGPVLEKLGEHANLDLNVKTTSPLLGKLTAAGKRLGTQTGRDLSAYLTALKLDPIIGLALELMTPVEPQEAAEVERRATERVEPGSTVPTVERLADELVELYRQSEVESRKP